VFGFENVSPMFKVMMIRNLMFANIIFFHNCSIFKNHFLQILSKSVDINEEDDGVGLYATMYK
jgi:hypothetical protein